MNNRRNDKIENINVMSATTKPNKIDRIKKIY